MELLIIGIASLLASLLTFFTGFGLGTMLMPVFAIFFPVDVAVALTGVVHLLNNIFKLFLVGNKADRSVALRFGIPAIVAAFLGAWLLLRISGLEPLFSYRLGERQFSVTPVKLTIAILLVIFALMESLPRLKKIQFGRDKMIIGGALSGFFGGLSGHQGALRSAFLVRAGLSKEAFIATGVIIACMIDLARLTVYFNRYISSGIRENTTLLVVATLAAFAGAFLGTLLLKKITFSLIQKIVTIMLLLLAVALGAGLV
jgi:uncharacterized membrane protein YfcA